MTYLEETKAQLEEAQKELDALIQARAKTNDQHSVADRMRQLWLEISGCNLIISDLSGR